MSWTLSYLSIVKFYPTIELVSDSSGYELLISNLQLPYKEASFNFDSNPVQDTIWTLRKLQVYAQQDEPFLHIDGDVFIYKQITEEIEYVPLIAQNEDINLYCYSYALNEILKRCNTLPQGIDSKTLPNGSNAGVIGGTNTAFFKKLYGIVIQFLNQNIGSLKDCDMNHLSTFLEQGCFYALAKSQGIEVRYLCDQSATEEFDLNLQDFYGIPQKTTYVHLMSSKKNFIVCEQLAQQLRLEYPDYYEKCLQTSRTLNSKHYSLKDISYSFDNTYNRTKLILSKLGYENDLLTNQNYFNKFVSEVINSNNSHKDVLNDVFCFEKAKTEFCSKMERRFFEEISIYEKETFNILKKDWKKIDNILCISYHDQFIEAEWNWVEVNEFNNQYTDPVKNLEIQAGYFKIAILTYPNSGKIKEFALDPLSIIIFEILQQPKTINEIVESLHKDFDVSKSFIDQKLEDRLRFLLYNHLIRFT